MPSLESICDVIASLGAAGVIGIAAFGLGRPALRRLNLPQSEPLFVAVWSMTLGLLIGGFLILALAATGCVYSGVIAAMTLAACFWSLVEFACIYLGAASGRVVEPRLALESAPPPSRPRGTVLVSTLAALVLLPSLVLALAPTTSSEALTGSLELPKQLLLDHGFSGDRFIASAGSNSMQPNMVHMWYLWALALNGPVAAALVHWGLGVLLALATVLLASVLLPPGHAWLAGCLVLLCPGVQHQLSLPLADLGLALFCTLALAAVGRIAIHLETARWPIAAGLMLGGAIATMPAGLAFAAAVGSFLAYVCGSSREPRRELAQAARPILAAALITAAPGLFFLGFALHQPGSTQSLQSVAIHLGPLLLLALGVLPATRRLRGLGLIVGVSAIYFVLASCSPWPGRWWSPLVPPAGIVAVWVWQEIANGPRAMSGLASIAVVLLAMTVPILGWTRSLGALAVATGWQHRDDFLLAREPIYRAASMLNRIGRSTDRLLCEACPGASTASTFYFNCAVTRKVAAGNSKSGSSAARDDAAWIEAARSGGFSYLLLAEALESASDARSNDMRSNLDGPHLFGSGDEVGPIGEVIPILEYQSADDNNRPIRYRLLRVAKCRR